MKLIPVVIDEERGSICPYCKNQSLGACPKEKYMNEVRIFRTFGGDDLLAQKNLYGVETLGVKAYDPVIKCPKYEEELFLTTIFDAIVRFLILIV